MSTAGARLGRYQTQSQLEVLPNHAASPQHNDRKTPLKQLFRLIVCLWLLPETTFADRAASPSDATVFIRVMGDLRLKYERFGTKSSIESRDTEITTGSGFVISPYGYVVTSHHVVTGGTSTEEVQGIEVQVTRQIARIEVVFPAARTGSGSGALLSRYRASVAASDPELDLAVLFIAGAELPYPARHRPASSRQVQT